MKFLGIKCYELYDQVRQEYLGTNAIGRTLNQTYDADTLSIRLLNSIKSRPQFGPNLGSMD